MFYTTLFSAAGTQHPSTAQPQAVSKAGFSPLASRPHGVHFDGSARPEFKLSRYIDHTLLMYPEGVNPDDAIRQLCQEAKTHGFYAVCVRPDKVKLARSCLKGTGIKVATVIGFPDHKSKLLDERANLTTGDVPLWQKLVETRQGLINGAQEIDLVMNVQQFLSETDQPLRTLREFQLIKTFAAGRKLKVILETDLLTADEIKKAVAVCAKAGVDLVKTSTGMITDGKGATVENVLLIRQTLDALGKRKTGIKASGGVRDAQGAQALVAAGATRLGTSQGVAIVKGEKANPGQY